LCVYTGVFTEFASAWLAVYYSGVERTRRDRDNISYFNVFPLSLNVEAAQLPLENCNAGAQPKEK
jgi:hypothetical protein